MMRVEPGADGGDDGILAGAVGNERLAWAAALGVPAFVDVLRDEPGFAGRSPSPARNPARAAADLLSRARELNRRWLRYLESVPIDDIRALQTDYNRYYPIEREMALRAVRMAFHEVPLLEAADLARWFPPLPEPGEGGHAGG